MPASERQFRSRLFDKRILHAGLLLILLLLVYAATRYPGSWPVYSGSFKEVSAKTWFWLSIISPVIHQVYVMITWRLELYGKILSKYLGKAAFTIYSFFFAVLGLSRFLIIPLAIANRGTIGISAALKWSLTILFLCLASWLFYSVFRWFGFERAAGLDHFKPTKAHSWPFVNKGIFKITSNGMYLFGFLILWAIAIFFESAGALTVAAFSHLYIWVHFYCTEKPDMIYIYGKSA